MENSYLEHHGIKGQKWYIRRYQNEDGSLTPAGREHYGVGPATTPKQQKRLAKDVEKTAKRFAKSRMSPGIGVSHRPYVKDIVRSSEKVNEYYEASKKRDAVYRELENKAKTDKKFAKEIANEAIKKHRELTGDGNEEFWNDQAEQLFSEDWDALDTALRYYADSGKNKEVSKVVAEVNNARVAMESELDSIAQNALGEYGNKPFIYSRNDGELIDKTLTEYMQSGLWWESNVYVSNKLTHSFTNSDHLEHHGIKGQKWGKKNGPPYPLDENDHSAAEKKLNKFTPSGVVAKYKDHKKKVQRQKALKKARATKAANAEAKKAAEEHEAAKQKALRSANAAEIMKYRDELTDNEMKDAVARIGWDETLRKKAKEQNPGKIEKAVKIVDKYGTMAGKVGDATAGFTKMYNNIAKVLNTFTDSDWPTIGDSKNGNQNDSDKKPESSKPSENKNNKNNRDKKNFDKVIREATRILGNAAKKVDEEESQKEAKSGAKGFKGEKWEKHDWTVDDKQSSGSSSNSSSSRKETFVDTKFEDVTPAQAEEVGRLAVERYLQLEDKRKG